MKSLWRMTAVALLAMACVALAPAVPASAQNTLNYHQQGGDLWVVDGTLRLHGVNLGVAKGNSYYVNTDTSACSNTYNGKSWAVSSTVNAGPWCTVTYALTQVADYDIIRVVGSVNEAVTIPYARSHVRLIGGGPTPRAAKWKYTTGGAPLITCNGDAPVISNFFFEAPSDSAAVKLVRSVGQTTAKCNNALIVGNEFWTGKYGIELAGAPHNVQILDNRLSNMRASGATAIYVSSQSDDFPRRAQIKWNWFSGNVNHLVGAFTDSNIAENVLLSAGLSNSTTTKLDLRNGNNNAVNRNVLGGTYSNAGGYYAGSNDEWVGNLIAGGLTTANPS